MAQDTKIEWATLGLNRGASFNPLRAFRKDDGKRGWACVRKNAACKNCYAAAMNKNRYYGSGLDYSVANLDQVDLQLIDVRKPLSWREPCGIFWCSMTDAFGEFVPSHFTAQMIATAVESKQHRHAFLTKRPERMLEFFKSIKRSDVCCEDDFPNHVWLGATVHDQACADEFMPHMRELRELLGEQAVIWISAEPLLGEIDLSEWIQEEILSWVVAGGESGGNARVMNPNHARQLRDQCVAAGVKFFFKQWGHYMPVLADINEPSMWDGMKMKAVGKKKSGRILDGREWSEFPL